MIRRPATGILLVALAVVLLACTSTEQTLDPNAIALSEGAGSGGSAGAVGQGKAGAASPQKMASAAAAARIEIAPVVGAAPAAAQPLTDELKARASARGLGIADAGTGPATHIIKGYFSAITEGPGTTPSMSGTCSTPPATACTAFRASSRRGAAARAGPPCRRAPCRPSPTRPSTSCSPGWRSARRWPAWRSPAQRLTLAAAPRRPARPERSMQAVAGGVEHVPDIDDRRPGPFRDRREIAFDDVRRRTGARHQAMPRPRADARAVSSSVERLRSRPRGPTPPARSFLAPPRARWPSFAGSLSPPCPARPSRPHRTTAARRGRWRFGSSVCSVLVKSQQNRSKRNEQDPGGRPSDHVAKPTPGKAALVAGHFTIKSRSWRDSGFGCDSVVR